jgi:hypothetical protein
MRRIRYAFVLSCLVASVGSTIFGVSIGVMAEEQFHQPQSRQNNNNNNNNNNNGSSRTTTATSSSSWLWLWPHGRRKNLKNDHPDAILAAEHDILKREFEWYKATARKRRRLHDDSNDEEDTYDNDDDDDAMIQGVRLLDFVSSYYEKTTNLRGALVVSR